LEKECEQFYCHGQHASIHSRRSHTRVPIADGRKQVPIENILLGAQSKRVTLTYKQKKFAQSIAL